MLLKQREKHSFFSKKRWAGARTPRKGTGKGTETAPGTDTEMATVRTVAGTALHLACFPNVCCPRSQRVDVKELLSTEDENTKYYG